MKTITAKNGGNILVDDEDYERLNQHAWSITRIRTNTYALRNIYKRGEPRIVIFMHRDVLNLNRGDGTRVDHWDHNGLNNQKGNLRLCTRSQNAANMHKDKSGNSSRYKGVYLDKRRRKWNAEITVGRKKKHLGAFNLEVDAAKAYDSAAKDNFGEYARLNLAA